MRGNNVCFYGAIRKIIPVTLLIKTTGIVCIFKGNISATILKDSATILKDYCFEGFCIQRSKYNLTEVITLCTNG